MAACLLHAVPAQAVSLDPATRTCLAASVGAKEAARIARATRLTATQRSAVQQCQASGESSKQAVVWMSDGSGGWMTSRTPPACPASLAWQLPIDDLGAVVTVLYPGQLRGGRYKGHGGFLMNASATTVRAPIDGYLVGVAAYRETLTGVPGPGGEVQYLLDIQHPCGMLVRFDHLKALSPRFASAVAAVPVRDDSRGTWINPPVKVKRGEVIATTVGYTELAVNPVFDFGVYDARSPQPNRRSKAELFAFGPDGQLGSYAVCWFDLFGAQTAAAIRAVPKTNVEAQQGSDTCS